MIQITEVAFTGYPVTDIVRARAFYENVLLLKPTATFENEGSHWIEYDIGPSTIAITNMSPKWKPSIDGPAVAFEVADFDEAVAVLRKAAVKFVVEPATSPVCRLAVVADPDGNQIAFHKRNSA
jgi:predicted enzyme related to lactoylglutathione lyase